MLTQVDLFDALAENFSRRKFQEAELCSPNLLAAVGFAKILAGVISHF